MLRLAHQSRALLGVQRAVVQRAPVRLASIHPLRLYSDSSDTSEGSKKTFRTGEEDTPVADSSLLPRVKRVEEAALYPRTTIDAKTQAALDTIEELGFKARQDWDVTKYTEEELDPRNWDGLEYHEIVSRLHNRQYAQGDAYSQSEIELQQLTRAGRRVGADAGVIRAAYFGKQTTVEKFEADDELDTDEHVNEFMYDDIPSVGHMQVEKVRKIRHLQRMSAYVLPRLVDYHVPFDPVEADKKKSPLTFKYTSYTGETADEEVKVVCYFDPKDLGLSAKGLHKFKLLSGMNYDVLTGQCKFASKRHPSAPENKHHLLSQIMKLKQEAETGDSFEDVPLDTRFARNKRERIEKRDRYRLAVFPKEWNRPEDKTKETAFKALFG